MEALVCTGFARPMAVERSDDNGKRWCRYENLCHCKTGESVGLNVAGSGQRLRAVDPTTAIDQLGEVAPSAQACLRALTGFGRVKVAVGVGIE